MHKSTKILCTIGPNSNDKEIIKKMFNQGLNGVRINTAHGDYDSYKRVITNTRAVCKVPIMIDIKGPELRIRTEEVQEVYKNKSFKIGVNENIRFNFDIYSKVKRNDKILLKDGRYKLIVTSKSDEKITVKAKEDFEIKPNMNVNIPDKNLDLPKLSKKDLESIKFAIKNEVEYIALSFCRNKYDVQNLKNKLKGTNIKIISKIENKEGIDNILEIIKESDGVMVARGDLGVELPGEQVPIAQKKIIHECNKSGKVVIVATQMLESMIQNPTPTRAEVSDIANAVLDGADCLMLSEETAMGRHPVKAVKQMSKVCRATEPFMYPSDHKSDKQEVSEQISASVVGLVTSLPVTKVICFTKSGYTAINVTKYRAHIPIIAVTNSEKVRRQLMLYYALDPVLYKGEAKINNIRLLTKFLLKRKIIDDTDLILFTAGISGIKKKHTNTIQIIQTSEIV